MTFISMVEFLSSSQASKVRSYLLVHLWTKLSYHTGQFCEKHAEYFEYRSNWRHFIIIQKGICKNDCEILGGQSKDIVRTELVPLRAKKRAKTSNLVWSYWFAPYSLLSVDLVHLRYEKNLYSILPSAKAGRDATGSSFVAVPLYKSCIFLLLTHNNNF